jgi:hypothetical protein
MLTRHSGPASRLGGLDSVGLGLFLGGPWFGHSGGNEGFKCHLVAHRTDGCGVAVMTNADRGHELVAEILDGLAREMAWLDWTYSERSEDEEPVTAVDALTGAYELRPGVVVEVARVGDELEVTLSGQPPIRFLRVSATEFGSFSVETSLALENGELVVRQNHGELRCRRMQS